MDIVTTSPKLTVKFVQEGWHEHRPYVSYIIGNHLVDILGDEGGNPMRVRSEPMREAGEPLEAMTLRSLPLSRATGRLRAMAARRAAPEEFPVPKRMRTTGDRKQFAATYMRAVDVCPSAPIRFLADLTGISYHTLAARVRSIDWEREGS